MVPTRSNFAHLAAGLNAKAGLVFGNKDATRVKGPALEGFVIPPG